METDNIILIRERHIESLVRKAEQEGRLYCHFIIQGCHKLKYGSDIEKICFGEEDCETRKQLAEDTIEDYKETSRLLKKVRYKKCQK